MTEFIFAGPQNSFYRALTLTDEFEFVTDPWQADVFVFNGEISEFSDFQTILKQGTPILLVMGEEVDASQLERLFGLPVEIEEKEEPLSLVPDQGISVEWVAQIAWSSAPQVRERYLPQGLEITPLVIGFEQDDLILGRTQALNSTVTIFTPGLETKPIHRSKNGPISIILFTAWSFRPCRKPQWVLDNIHTPRCPMRATGFSFLQPWR